MADNFPFTGGSGLIGAADDVSGVLYQRIKLALGADGTANDADVGVGAVDLGTLRVTLASDDPAVVALQLIDNAISGNEMQVDIVSSALPSGAATEAKQPALGTAGSASADVITVQGVASMTPLRVDNGGTFAVQVDGAALTALQIMDDWDESDRAKVNLIAGQAGISAGAGAVAANTPRTTLASDDPAVALLGTIDTDTGAISTNTTNIPDALAGEYETVAASQTAQALGATGATGDFISHVLVIPATTSPGNVILLDNATSITIFTGGTDSVSNLVPFHIPLQMYSASGAWSITTGANVSVIAVGNFT